VYSLIANMCIHVMKSCYVFLRNLHTLEQTSPLLFRVNKRSMQYFKCSLITSFTYMQFQSLECFSCGLPPSNSVICVRKIFNKLIWWNSLQINLQFEIQGQAEPCLALTMWNLKWEGREGSFCTKPHKIVLISKESLQVQVVKLKHKGILSDTWNKVYLHAVLFTNVQHLHWYACTSCCS
jgi:hypothetical protein